MDTSSVGAIIVNYEAEAATQRLAGQLNDICDAVVIVDNSAPSGLERWAAETAGVDYIDSGGNVGYAAGNNQGIEYLHNSVGYYFIVNPDIELPEPDIIPELSRKLQADPQLGILAPAIGESSPSSQHQDTFPVRLLHRLGRLPPLNDRDDGLVPRTQIVGCSMLVSADMVDEIGRLDPRFFLYVEEVEFCYRAREHGYQIAYDPGSVVNHESEDGFSHPDAYQVYYRARNVFLLARSHLDGLAQAIYLLSAPVILFAILKNLEWDLVGPWLRGVVDGILGREGKGPYP